MFLVELLSTQILRGLLFGNLKRVYAAHVYITLYERVQNWIVGVRESESQGGLKLRARAADQ